MGDHIDWSGVFLSASGRIARAPFLIAATVLLVAVALYESVVQTLPLMHWATGLFVYPVLLYCGACALSKRLHDRGRSGWWAAPILLALAAVWPRPTGFFDFLFGVFLVWAAVELAVIAGERGTNRFGPSPRATQATA